MPIVVIAAAAGGEGKQHDQGQKQCRDSFHFSSSFGVFNKTGAARALSVVTFIVRANGKKEQGANLRFFGCF